MVDHAIIVWSESSNYGEIEKNYLYGHVPVSDKITLVKWEPDLNKAASENERAKRNFGLNEAKKMQFTHFLMCDADEFYVPEQFLKAKERIFKEDLTGMVCPLDVYFGSPDLCAGRDTTLVPFIHKLTMGMRYEWNKRYPFAWTGQNLRIDPTRQLNIYAGVVYSEDIVMSHFSWIRKDFGKKIRNSSARDNILKSDVLTELGLAKEGYYCNFYRKTLSRATVDFGICL